MRVALLAKSLRLGAFAVIAAGLALSVGAALAFASDRESLWQVVRACVADAKLTGLPFPCLSVDLGHGEARGAVALRPPWANDLIVSPTTRIGGVEDPFLQSDEAPNYFAAAWRARRLIATVNGRPLVRDQIAMVANSRLVRAQDQLHIHVGCLLPGPRRALAEAAPKLPLDSWRLIASVVPHQPFWAMRVESADLERVDPIRLVYDRLGRSVPDPASMAIGVVGATVDAEDDFLILASYAGLHGSWWPVGSDDLMDGRCQGDAIRGEDSQAGR